jgi:predicted nucleic acid-binding protein
MVNDFVVDCSAVVLATTTKFKHARELRQRLMDSECHTPHHFDAEFGGVLRRHELSGQLDTETAVTALQVVQYLVNHRYPLVGSLGETAWTLRRAVTFYDALYVALAARLDVPLLTADARLSRSPSLPCKVEVVA